MESSEYSIDKNYSSIVFAVEYSNTRVLAAGPAAAAAAVQQRSAAELVRGGLSAFVIHLTRFVKDSGMTCRSRRPVVLSAECRTHDKHVNKSDDDLHRSRNETLRT